MTTASPSQPSFGLRLNLGLLHVARHWTRYAAALLGIYVGFAVLAPVLMKAGLNGPAQVLYSLYSPFCHQFAFRSLFLFGEQAAYPRAISGSDLQPYESYVANDPAFLAAYDYEYRTRHNNQSSPPPTSTELATGFTPWLQLASRTFAGNEQMGYKTTLCARDMAIYAAMFVGALVYNIPVVRRRLRPAPILLYALLGLGPIGLDGFSQLLGYPPFNLWPPRETLPIFRVLTGALFGIMNVWLAFPYLEDSMAQTRRQIQAKLVAAGVVSPS